MNPGGEFAQSLDKCLLAARALWKQLDESDFGPDTVGKTNLGPDTVGETCWGDKETLPISAPGKKISAPEQKIMPLKSRRRREKKS